MITLTKAVFKVTYKYLEGDIYFSSNREGNNMILDHVEIYRPSFSLSFDVNSQNHSLLIGYQETLKDTAELLEMINLEITRIYKEFKKGIKDDTSLHTTN